MSEGARGGCRGRGSDLHLGSDEGLLDAVEEQGSSSNVGTLLERSFQQHSQELLARSNTTL